MFAFQGIPKNKTYFVPKCTICNLTEFSLKSTTTTENLWDITQWQYIEMTSSNQTSFSVFEKLFFQKTIWRHNRDQISNKKLLFQMSKEACQILSNQDSTDCILYIWVKNKTLSWRNCNFFLWNFLDVLKIVNCKPT